MRFSAFCPWVFGAAALLVAPASVRAQSPSPEIADCGMVGLEVSPRIFEVPGDVHVVALDYRNVTAASCRLHRYGLKEPYLQIEPGGVAHASFRWKAKGDSTTACRELPFATINVNIGLQGMQWNPGGLLLAGPRLLPAECSEPNGDSIYARGPFVPDSPETNREPPARRPSVTLAAVPLEYYGARRSFDLTVSNFDDTLPLGKDGCPIVLSEWTISGFLRFEERSHLHCVVSTDSGRASTWMRLQETEGSPGGPGPTVSRFAVFLGYSAQGEMLFAHSNAITSEAHWVASETLARHWGTEQHGVRASLTLDKTHYKLGEDISLHIFVEETASDRLLYGEPFGPRAAFFASPVQSMSLEIRDGVGPRPRSGERGNLLYPFRGGSSGSIVCPQPLKAGEESRVDRSLKHAGLLPDAPGTYTLAISWSVYATDQTSCPDFKSGNQMPRSEPFATVRSQPVTVTIDSLMPDVPSVRGPTR